MYNLLRNPNQAPLQDLSQREKDVYEWLKMDFANQEIADILGVTIHTIKHHVGEILEKFGVKSRYELIQTEPELVRNVIRAQEDLLEEASKGESAEVSKLAYLQSQVERHSDILKEYRETKEKFRLNEVEETAA